MASKSQHAHSKKIFMTLLKTISSKMSTTNKIRGYWEMDLTFSKSKKNATPPAGRVFIAKV